MHRKWNPLSFPKGFLAKRIIDPSIDKVVIHHYIIGRLYKNEEIEFNFWMLVFKKYIDEAV